MILKYIIDNIEISLDSDKENSDKKTSNEENPNEEYFDEKHSDEENYKSTKKNYFITFFCIYENGK